MSQRLSKGVKPVHSSCKLLCNVDVSHGPIKQKCRRCVAVNMGMHLPDDPTGWKCRHCLAGGPHWLQKVVLLHSNGVIAVWGTQVALASTSRAAVTSKPGHSVQCAYCKCCSCFCSMAAPSLRARLHGATSFSECSIGNYCFHIQNS